MRFGGAAMAGRIGRGGLGEKEIPRLCRLLFKLIELAPKTIRELQGAERRETVPSDRMRRHTPDILQ
jgi:hypothetical protein